MQYFLKMVLKLSNIALLIKLFVVNSVNLLDNLDEFLNEFSAENLRLVNKSDKSL